MLDCELRIIMAKNKFYINQVVELTGLSQPTVSKLFNNKPEEVKTVKLDTIDKLCKVFNCQIGDMLKYIPDTKKKEKK